MSFGASFASGYAVGKDMRKRRATSNFFKEVKNLLAEDDEEMVTADGTAIPVEKPADSAVEAEPVATEALPIETKTAVQVDSKELAPTDAPPPAEAPAEPAAGAIPVDAAPAVPAEEPPADAETALPLDAPPEAKAEATKLDKAVEGMAKAQKSITQADIKRLDKLALKAAEASGDVEVYTALQKTTDSLLQGRVQKYLGMAQVAAQNGDTESVEKYLTRAYRFVPDGQEVNFKKQDGKLFIPDPWHEGEGDPKMIPLGAEQIGYMATMISNPEKWGDIMREGRAKRREEAREDRKVTADEQRAGAYVKMTDAQIDNMEKQLGISRGELRVKQRNQDLDELNGKVGRLATYQQALYYGALAEQTRAGGKGSTLSLDQLMGNARNMATDVDKQFSAYTTPPTDPITGQPDRTWKAPQDIAGLSPQHIQQANGLAQAIGAANLQATDVSPGLAVAAGLALARAGAKDENGNPMGAVDIDAKAGTMTFEHNGRPTTLKLPGAVLQSLIATEAQKRQGAAVGLPSPVQFEDPFAPQAPIFGQQP